MTMVRIGLNPHSILAVINIVTECFGTTAIKDWLFNLKSIVNPIFIKCKLFTNNKRKYCSFCQ